MYYGQVMNFPVETSTILFTYTDPVMHHYVESSNYIYYDQVMHMAVLGLRFLGRYTPNSPF